MSPSLAISERARPQAFLCVAPFVLWFVLAAFLPDTWTPKPVIFDIPVRGADLILLCAALMSFGGWLVAGYLSASPRRWHKNIPLSFGLLLVYAAISMLWAGMDSYNTRAMMYSLVFAAAAFTLPFSVLSSLTTQQIRFFARIMALGLSVAGAVYSMESFFQLGLRSELGTFYSNGFGISRVKGPLFEPSTGYMVLLPAAAVLLQHSLEEGQWSIVNLAGLGALSISLLGLGSRFALIVAAVFIVAIFVTGKSVRSFQISGLGLAGIALSAVFVFQYASTERLQSFGDADRAATYVTAFNAVEERSTAVSLAGSGYGSFWPWYMRDWELGDRAVRGQDMVSTDYGMSLFHPHSLFLLLGVELGLAGLLFFVKIWSVLGKLVSSAVARQENYIAAIGIACGALGMFADTIMFKLPKVSSVWWFFLLAALSAQSVDSPGERTA